MNKQDIEDEAIKYCSHIDFSNDKSLNEKGRVKVAEWCKQDFIAGVEWMQEQLHLSAVMQQSEQLFTFLEYCDNAGWIKNIDKKQIIEDYEKANNCA